MKTHFNLLCSITLFMGLALLSSCEPSPEMASTEVAEAPANTSNADGTKTEEKNDQKVIRHADVQFQVEDMETSMSRIDQIARQHQAIVSNTSQHTAGDQQTTDFEIRVKPEQFMVLLDQIQKQSIKLDFRTLSADNVTMEYVDIAARIKAKRTTEQRYLDLLKEAKNIEEVMRVESELKLIREDIESAEARMRYLADQTAYSTIKLSIYQIVPVSLSERTGFGIRLTNAFGTGWHLLITLIISICYIWPLWVLGAIYWFMRNRKLI